jgi:hypothetical protein
MRSLEGSRARDPSLAGLLYWAYSSYLHFILLGATIMRRNEDRAMTTHKCPECGTHKVCRASRHGTLERVLAIVNVYPYRCRQCPSRKRFYNFGRR